jgi:hypothetical protein
MQKTTGAAAVRAAVIFFCGGVVACSSAPPEPAPEFTLPISQVSTAPPAPQDAGASASAPSRLRYIAVPPGQNVAGMAHARVVVKQKKVTRHGHTHKKAVAHRAAIKEPTKTDTPTVKP